MDNLAILIPCYNEERTIEKLLKIVEEVLRILKKRLYTYTIITQQIGQSNWLKRPVLLLDISTSKAKETL